MPEVIIGCDPGAHGAFAVMIDGELVDIDDMPILTVKVGKTMRARVDLDGVWDLFKQYEALHIRPGDRVLFVIEEVGPTPKDGARSAFAFGRGSAVPEVCAAGMGWPRTKVTPPVWKRQLKLRKEKDEARRRAKELFPGFSRTFARVKDDGRAEAALLAVWARAFGREIA